MLLPLLLFFAIGATQASRAHALDKRVKLMFKTAGYGAAAGFIIGAGTAAMGMGGLRNAFMGASAGMYAGILLAAYVIVTPPDEPDRPKRPVGPRRPMGPEDWREESDDEYENMIDKRDDESMANQPRSDLLSRSDEGLNGRALGAPIQLELHDALVWMPVLSLNF